MVCAPALAQMPVDMKAIDHELAGIQSAIDAGAANGALNPEAVQALEGKQKELTDRAARLEQQGPITTDEATALNQSVAQQEARLKAYTKTRAAARAVDPASLPPPVIEGPYGTVTTGGVNQPVASPVITPAPIAAPTYAGPTTLLSNGAVVPAGNAAPTGSITTNVTPGAAQ